MRSQALLDGGGVVPGTKAKIGPFRVRPDFAMFVKYFDPLRQIMLDAVDESLEFVVLTAVYGMVY